MSSRDEVVQVKGEKCRIRCYDNAGKTADRYTVVYMDCPERSLPGSYAAVGMNAEPFHPQGIGMHTSAMPGEHLGRRVRLSELPEDCQKLVQRDLDEIAAHKQRERIGELVASHGFGEPTEEGYKVCRELMDSGDDMATAAAEVASRGLTTEAEESEQERGGVER